MAFNFYIICCGKNEETVWFGAEPSEQDAEDIAWRAKRIFWYFL